MAEIYGGLNQFQLKFALTRDNKGCCWFSAIHVFHLGIIYLTFPRIKAVRWIISIALRLGKNIYSFFIEM